MILLFLTWLVIEQLIQFSPLPRKGTLIDRPHRPDPTKSDRPAHP
ncbi:hypothetical protein [Microcoleus sp. B4-D4]